MLRYLVRYIDALPPYGYSEITFSLYHDAFTFARSIRRLGGLADDPEPVRIGGG